MYQVLSHIHVWLFDPHSLIFPLAIVVEYSNFQESDVMSQIGLPSICYYIGSCNTPKRNPIFLIVFSDDST